MDLGPRFPQGNQASRTSYLPCRRDFADSSSSSCAQALPDLRNIGLYNFQVPSLFGSIPIVFQNILTIVRTPSYLLSMSRSTFRTTVGNLLAQCEAGDDFPIVRLPRPSHTSENHSVHLGEVYPNRRIVVHHTSAEPQTIELDGLAWSEELYAALEAVKVGTSSSSGDSAEAATPTFTPPQRSKSSSESTSVLPNDEQNEDSGVSVI